MTAQELNKLVGQYEPLINKITAQMSSNARYPWAEVKSMAYEGFAVAISKYNEEKSDLSFLQFAGNYIRNYILIGLNDEMHTVKFPAYARQTSENGISMIRFDAPVGEDTETIREIKINMYHEETHEIQGIDYLLKKLEAHFSKKDVEIFVENFDLDGQGLKGVEIAKKHSVSPAYVSLKVKAIVKYIKQNEELCEVIKEHFGI